MRKVILNLAVSLDGYIAGPNGEYDWCLTDNDYGMTDFLSSVDAILMGRKSYEIVVSYSAPYPDKKVFVVSNTLKSSPFKNVVIQPDDVGGFVKALKQSDGKNIWLFGGGQLIETLYDLDLIDHWVLSIHPVVLGSGIPLVNSRKRLNLQLQDTVSYPSGLVQCTYQTKRI